ncbi:MAG: hypothetical protein OFPII_03150 [Osedax symbiont Rs1]|nr:MAG: hypothetical protein OFPII_03150 [Osedax symbiont Rs1]
MQRSDYIKNLTILLLLNIVLILKIFLMKIQVSTTMKILCKELKGPLK